MSVKGLATYKAEPDDLQGRRPCGVMFGNVEDIPFIRESIWNAQNSDRPTKFTSPYESVWIDCDIMEGRCQCGQVHFVTPIPKPLHIYICHCTECRHQSSSTYGMTMTFPAFEIHPPSPNSIAIYSRPNPNGRTDGYFCTMCGCRLLHRAFSRMGEGAKTVSVKSGCLDGVTKEMMRSAVHIWTKSAVIDIPEDAKAYEEEPPGGSFSGDWHIPTGVMKQIDLRVSDVISFQNTKIQ